MLPVIDAALSLLGHSADNDDDLGSLAGELRGLLELISVDDRAPERDHSSADQHNGEAPEDGEFGEDITQAATLE